MEEIQEATGIDPWFLYQLLEIVKQEAWYRGLDEVTDVVDYSGDGFIGGVLDEDIDGDGTLDTAEDLNGDGLLDIATSNKKGVHVFHQVRR